MCDCAAPQRPPAVERSRTRDRASPRATAPPGCAGASWIVRAAPRGSTTGSRSARRTCVCDAATTGTRRPTPEPRAAPEGPTGTRTSSERPSVPAHRQCRAGQEQGEARTGEQRGHLGLLPVDRELQVERVVDPVQARGVAGSEILPLATRRDPAEEPGVEVGGDAEAIDVQHRTARAPDTDREDADTRL